MSFAATNTYDAPRTGWIAQGRDWIDQRGRAGWIVATVAGFVLFWPLGLALLGYVLMTGRMGAGCRKSGRAGLVGRAMRSAKPSGNRAFDAYKEETLRRLEEEQAQFESFLERLREARDKAEFDQFMKERAEKKTDSPETEA